MSETKRGRGRPKSTTPMARLHIRIAAQRHAFYAEAARKSGVNLTTWVLDACDRRALLSGVAVPWERITVKKKTPPKAPTA